MNEIYGRLPPQSIDAEKGVLGAILMERDAFDMVSGILTPGKFYTEAHQHIFQAMADLNGKGAPLDIITVLEQLKVNGTLERTEGAYYITQLTNNVVNSYGTGRHANIVFRKFIQREMIRVSAEILNRAYEETDDVYTMLEEAEQNLLDIGNQNIHNEMATASDVAFKAMQQVAKWMAEDRFITGVPSNLKGVDRATRGWQPEDLIILAARPSVGKTALALMLAKAASSNDINPVDVALFSLEMKNTSLMLRMISEESGVMLYKMQTGKMSKEEFAQVNKAAGKIADRNIYFDDSNGLTLYTLRSKLRRLKKKRPKLGLVIIDYLQLMSAEGKGNREQEISSISRGLKGLARELGLPIIALSQLSRDLEKGGKPREPQISDLRESGAIEQDADLVMLAWGASEDDIKRDPSLINRRYLKGAKQRNGFLFREELVFDTTIQRIAEYEGQVEAAKGYRPVAQAGNLFDKDLPI